MRPTRSDTAPVTGNQKKLDSADEECDDQRVGDGKMQHLTAEGRAIDVIRYNETVVIETSIIPAKIMPNAQHRGKDFPHVQPVRAGLDSVSCSERRSMKMNGSWIRQPTKNGYAGRSLRPGATCRISPSRGHETMAGGLPA